MCPITVELKGTIRQDPILQDEFKEDISHDGTLAQIAKNGRNILAASGACFCFVVGIYGDTARIYRLDRAHGVISPSFELRSTNILYPLSISLAHRSCNETPSTTTGCSILSNPKLLGLDATITKLSHKVAEDSERKI